MFAFPERSPAIAIELGAAYISILPDTDRLAPGIRRALAGADREFSGSGSKAGKSFKSSFLGALGGAAKGGIFAAFAGGSLLGGAGLKTAAELEQTKIGFETMLGSAKEANRFLAQIKKTAAKTPFELTGLTSSSQKLLAFGFDVKDVIPSLTTLGDAAAGLGKGSAGLDQLVNAVGQIQAKGKVQGDELLQLTEAGIPAQKILQNQLGITAKRFAELQAAGKISATQAIPALLDGIKNGTKGLAGETAAFGGLMEKQSRSLAGVASTFKDKLFLGAAKAIKPLIPLIKSGLLAATEALGPAFRGLSSGIATVTGLFTSGGPGLSKWSGILSMTADTVRGFVTALLPTLKAFATNLLGTLGPGLASIGEAVRTQLLPAFNNVLPVLAPVAKFVIGILGNAVIGAAKGAIQALKGLVSIVSGVFNLVASLIKGDWGGAWDALKQIFSGAIDAVVGLLKVWWNVGILAVFRKGVVALLTGWKGLWSGLANLSKRAFTGLGNLFSRALAGIARLVLGAVKTYINIWKGLFRTALGLARTGWKVLRSAFGGAVAAIRTVIVGAVRAYIGAWKGLFTVLRAAAVKGMNLVKGGISKALDAIKGAFSKAISAIKAIWDGLKAAAAAPARFVIETVYNNGIRKMIGALPGVGTPPAISAGFASGGWTGPGGRLTPAGIVHADEFVVSKAARRNLEASAPGALDYMNRTGAWPTYGLGGKVKEKLLDKFADLIALARSVAGSVFGMSGAGWSGLIRPTALGAARGVKDWINGKIPGPGPIPGGIFDQGGVLNPGAIAMNMSKRPEAVFTHRQFRDLAGSASGGRREFTITNWRDGTGYFRDIAEDTYNGERSFEGTAARMNRPV